ncbi:polysaccharide deacetylase family protein [Sporosarcina sp. GW1-11]|uniref:polysaccharide deacetylase family protein n=1 Tax=Sporosarcina sp. GW1-11 TaxID=2899126 RepID=UPI00294FD835|nr:polysaccharide deacetylase family protein [Sporosarcina sp. GW1-11]MDV6379111.1 polysaccharide deacetylase family protein [Sporosarcina sp. GW1-11]
MSTLGQEVRWKRRRLKKQYFLILLLVLFGTVFFVGKSYSFRELPSAPDEPLTTLEPTDTAELTDTPEPTDTPELTDSPEPIDAPEESSPQPEALTEVESDKTEENTPKKVVYLTFDDGPGKLTEQFLDVLQAHGVKATFFMQGSNLKKDYLQDSVRRAVQEGHYIGGHSVTHNYKTLYTDQQFVPEMVETLDLIHEITGTTPHLVRPPYGSAPGLKNEQIRKQLADAHIKVWDWTIDSYDWKLAGNPSQIVQNIKQGTSSDREIVLMHEKKQTLEALPRVLTFFKEQGYEFAVYDDAHHFVLNFQNDLAL